MIVDWRCKVCDTLNETNMDSFHKVVHCSTCKSKFILNLSVSTNFIEEAEGLTKCKDCQFYKRDLSQSIYACNSTKCDLDSSELSTRKISNSSVCCRENVRKLIVHFIQVLDKEGLSIQADTKYGFDQCLESLKEKLKCNDILLKVIMDPSTFIKGEKYVFNLRVSEGMLVVTCTQSNTPSVKTIDIKTYLTYKSQIENAIMQWFKKQQNKVMGF